MPNRTIILAVLGVLITQFTAAQNCTYSLSGSITDFHDRTVLPGATVMVIGTENAVLSDLTGFYELKGLCVGRIELEISHPDCTTLTIVVDITGNRVFDIVLEHHLEELDEVEVIGDIVKEETNSAQEATLKLESLEQFSVANLGDALRELGGVSSLNTGANIVKPAIHGLNGSRVLILNDGVRMQDMEWGAEHAPNVDINSTGSVTVVKGASALQYGGDAIGGTIILEPGRIPKKDSLYGKTLLNGALNGRGGNISSTLTRSFESGWFVKGQAAYKRMGDLEAPDYILSNTGIQEIAAKLQFGKHGFTSGWDAQYAYFNTEIAILRASHIGNVDDLIRSINSGQPEIIRPFTYDLQNPRQEVTHHLGRLKYYKRFEGAGRWNLQYDFQSNRRFEFDVRRGERDNTASIDLELTTHTLSTDFKWDARDGFQLLFGLMGRYQDNFANPDTGVRRLIPDYEKWDFGTFAIGEFEVTETFLLEGGMRYDFSRVDAQKFYQTSRWEERGYDQQFQELVVSDLGTQLLVNPVFDFNNFSGTLGGRITFEDFSTLKFNLTRSQRAPNPSELFSDGLHHSAARIELGDLRIKSETSNKLALTYDKGFKNWGILLEPFANWISDFILLEPSGVEFTLRGAFPVWEYRQVDARLLGIDLSAYANWTTDWSTEHQFSLVKGTDLSNNRALINVPAAQVRNKLLYKKPKWKGFEAVLSSRYVFRQNEVPENIVVFSPEQQQEVELAINSAPPAYHVLDFRSQMKFPMGDKTALTAALTVNNLLNTNYRDYLNRQRYFADDLGRNIILQLKFNY